MAEFDIVSNQTKYESQLTQFFQALEAQNPDFQNELYAVSRLSMQADHWLALVFFSVESVLTFCHEFQLNYAL